MGFAGFRCIGGVFLGRWRRRRGSRRDGRKPQEEIFEAPYKMLDCLCEAYVNWVFHLAIRSGCHVDPRRDKGRVDVLNDFVELFEGFGHRDTVRRVLLRHGLNKRDQEVE